MSDDIVVIDGEAVEVGELVPVQHHGTGIAVAPEVGAQDLIQRLAVIKDAMLHAMESGLDYGVIPGTDKPALFKPGAEKLSVLFQLDIQCENEKIWHEDGHLTVISKAIAYHAPTGTRLGSGEGICTTKESRYAYRNANRVCPDCGQEAIIKGKEEYGGGWVCFKKKGGCGQKFRDDSPEIVGQKVGKVDNPDIADSYNTCDKMASKRARVDAVLNVTGASALFTQDVTDENPSKARTGAPAASQEQRSDGKREPTGARSWADWQRLMDQLEVPDPKEWLRLASEAAGVEKSAWGGDLSQRANRVLLHLSDNPPASSLSFWSVPELQKAFAAGFNGVIVENGPIGEAKEEK